VRERGWVVVMVGEGGREEKKGKREKASKCWSRRVGR